jgi:flagellar biosynthesis protein FliR
MSWILSSIGTAFLYVVAFACSVGAVAVLLAVLLSCIVDYNLKGKSDPDQQGVGAMLSGAIIGAILGAIFGIYILSVTTVGSAFLSILGLSAVLASLIGGVLFAGRFRNNRAVAPKRFRSF